MIIDNAVALVITFDEWTAYIATPEEDFADVLKERLTEVLAPRIATWKQRQQLSQLQYGSNELYKLEEDILDNYAYDIKVRVIEADDPELDMIDASFTQSAKRPYDDSRSKGKGRGKGRGKHSSDRSRSSYSQSWGESR